MFTLLKIARLANFKFFILSYLKFMNTIIAIKLENRSQDAIKFQNILTKYGCSINTRIGLHTNNDYTCNNYGLMLIEVTDKVNDIYDELSKYWDIQMIKF